MNKDELLKLLDTLKLDRKEFWILSSASLVLRDLYPKANDLDIAVSDKGLEELKKNYNLIEKTNNWYQITDTIECVCDGPIENLVNKPEVVLGYNLQNIKDYYEYLIRKNREKDQDRIPIVKMYMEKLEKEN